jgi:hypothetical protein
MSSAIDPMAFLRLVPRSIRQRSGSVFYSGRAAFSRPSPLYILGLNPGGSLIVQADETIERDIASYAEPSKECWSRYADESWGGRLPGTSGMQPRVLHLLYGLRLDARAVPASNVVFVRSAREATLKAEKLALLRACWPVHQAVIESLGVRVLLCFGSTAARWAREVLDAHELVGTFTERNRRRWTSTAHANADGTCVVKVTHPSIADWRNPVADPTRLVRDILTRTTPLV